MELSCDSFCFDMPNLYCCPESCELSLLILLTFDLPVVILDLFPSIAGILVTCFFRATNFFGFWFLRRSWR